MSGLVAPGRLELHMHGKDAHFWSPQLIVDVEELASGCKLLGRFGPHPSVWTLFMAAYAACGLLGLMSAIFGFSQRMIEQPPLALWGIPVTLALASGLYALGVLGKGLSEDQMEQLKQVLFETVDPAEPRPALEATS